MVFLDHVQNLHIHAEKTHKDSGAHCMNILILYMVEKTHTGPYYRVQALFMCGVLQCKCSTSSYWYSSPPAGSGKVLLAVRTCIVFLNRVQNLQIHVMRANQYICIFSQFSEFRIQNMHSTLCVFSVDFQKHASEYEVLSSRALVCF